MPRSHFYTRVALRLVTATLFASGCAHEPAVDSDAISFLQAVRKIVDHGKLEDASAISRALGIEMPAVEASRGRIIPMTNPRKDVRVLRYARGTTNRSVLLDLDMNPEQVCVTPENVLSSFGADAKRVVSRRDLVLPRKPGDR